MNIVSKALIETGRFLDLAFTKVFSPRLTEGFSEIQFASKGLQKLINDYEFESVLDIGSGAGNHSEILRKAGKSVTAIDYGDSIYFKAAKGKVDTVIGDFNEFNFGRKFDCIWCSHVLEHQLDTHSFLVKVSSVLKEGGVLAITVPPLKDEIVGGHVSLWNAGMLLYRLILAGFDCKNASVLHYGYNVTVIVKKETVNALELIEYDSGDIRKLKHFFPDGISFKRKKTDDTFAGSIDRINW